MFNNNLINNPIGWADKAVGKKRNYFLMVFCQIVMAAINASIVAFVAVKEYKKIPIDLVILAFIITALFPLFYLRAMRGLVVERRK